ncbi:MAG: PTS sugar transporter subunit IIA [Candidatus Omnitrophica bacterium]|nr:PTS sugar transporter subunit IIA [Candidatus Omnitrophota bacterium]MBU1127697.1 PTS sugar transporter subunit IIA [Candidatus Omnitrophota bacterium]MBU1784236.1 PTS sugar transporter subunit IIA [Candidatus Omnitrophota bacterium]MBU1851929.1 PTS sugar transporter subunit IIA [Candidatus Omnitrophota bacterium]
MPLNNVLTTKEVATYLKLNEKTVLKMAQSGEIPAVKIANQWRFYLSSIDEYMQDKIIKFSKYDFGKFLKSPDILPLSRLVHPDCINLHMLSETKDDVLVELVETAKKSKIAVSSDELINQLKKREEMLSTAIGNGIAIPHPRNPNDELFQKPGIIIGRTMKGVDFSAPDGKKVHLFFMTCAPDVVLHLKLLSKIAVLLNVDSIFENFMKAISKNDIMRILLKQERINA